MPMHYPPLADGTYRYGDAPRPLPSPVPGPEYDPAHPPPDGPQPADQRPAGQPATALPYQSGPPHQFDPQPRSGPLHQADPPDAPPEQDDSGGTRPKGTVAAASIVGGLGLVVVAILGTALFVVSGRDRVELPTSASVPGPAATGPFTVEGRFTVVSSPDAPVSGDRDGCDLPASLSDIGENTEITLVDGLQNSLGTTNLAYGEGDLYSCTFTFEFADVPAGLSLYSLGLDGRGQLAYTETELRNGIDITLGR